MLAQSSDLSLDLKAQETSMVAGQNIGAASAIPGRGRAEPFGSGIVGADGFDFKGENSSNLEPR